MTLYLRLLFLGPSQLFNMTVILLNTNTYNYTLQGVRSCDPFRLCIRAENEVGNSSWSCISNTLPFLPQREDIEYSLDMINKTFTLQVTVQVRCYVIVCESFYINNIVASKLIPEDCQSSMNSYCLKVPSTIGVCTSIDNVKSNDSYVALLRKGLTGSSFYMYTIVSSNSIGQQETTPFSFCKTSYSIYIVLF